MSDFSAAAMVRLIALGLRKQNLPVPVQTDPAGAHAPLTDKRALLDDVLFRHGPLTLLRIGAACRQLPPEPATVALALARDPHDLLARWQRLERFVHSRHRVRMASSGTGSLQLEHVSLDAGEPPRAAEDLVVFGLLVALISACGARDLRARFPQSAQWRYASGGWSGSGTLHDTAVIDLSWQPAPSPPPPLPPTNAGDDALHLRQSITADPGRGWTIASAADGLGLSPRSLQRRLRERGLRFAALLTDCRLALAAEMLAASRASTAEIGYACGFADQAHFTRAFRRKTALTPALFRREFGNKCASVRSPEPRFAARPD